MVIILWVPENIKGIRLNPTLIYTERSDEPEVLRTQLILEDNLKSGSRRAALANQINVNQKNACRFIINCLPGIIAVN
jgi:hypothetical protein